MENVLVGVKILANRFNGFITTKLYCVLEILVQVLWVLAYQKIIKFSLEYSVKIVLNGF